MLQHTKWSTLEGGLKNLLILEVLRPFQQHLPQRYKKVNPKRKVAGISQPFYWTVHPCEVSSGEKFVQFWAKGETCRRRAYQENPRTLTIIPSKLIQGSTILRCCKEHRMREQLGVARKVIVVGEMRCLSKINTSFCVYITWLFFCELRYFGKISLQPWNVHFTLKVETGNQKIRLQENFSQDFRDLNGSTKHNSQLPESNSREWA